MKDIEINYQKMMIYIIKKTVQDYVSIYFFFIFTKKEMHE